MKASKERQPKVALILVLGLLAGLAGWVLPSGKLAMRTVAESYKAATRSPIATGRLVSTIPLPAMDGPMCELEAASASLSLAEALQQTAAAALLSADEAKSTRNAELVKLQPIRTIRDPYAAFSAVAVDLTNNEVVMTDENLFQILVYNRLDNTPVTAKMTEPKRVLSGDNTEIEFQCGLYIDPKTGDIYGTNNDTVDQLVIFSREARGDVPPTRQLHTPHGTFGIGVDEDKQQLYLTIQHDNAVVVYPKYAVKEEPPIRLLQGDHTLLADPHGIALDPKNNLMFVTNFGSTATKVKGSGESIPNWPLSNVVPGSGRFLPPSITVYRMDSSGDTPPLRVIQGPKSRLNWATGISVDSERGELLVANDMGDEVLVFDLSAQGDAAPKRVLKGPKTQIKNPTGLYVDVKNDELWVTNFGNHSATVYQRGAGGDTPPLRVIRSGPTDAVAPMMGNPHPVAYDSKRDEILVPN